MKYFEFIVKILITLGIKKKPYTGRYTFINIEKYCGINTYPNLPFLPLILVVSMSRKKMVIKKILTPLK